MIMAALSCVPAAFSILVLAVVVLVAVSGVAVVLAALLGMSFVAVVLVAVALVAVIAMLALAAGTCAVSGVLVRIFPSRMLLVIMPLGSTVLVRAMIMRSMFVMHSGFAAGALLRYEIHSALGTLARLVLLDLQVHRAGVGGPGFESGGLEVLRLPDECAFAEGQA